MEKTVYISFDKEADVVYLSFGKPVKAAGEEVQNGVYARYTPDTHELVGFTITGFSRKFGADPKEIVIPATG